jgi:tetratricopeptide (TPR) repeat protein
VPGWLATRASALDNPRTAASDGEVVGVSPRQRATDGAQRDPPRVAWQRYFLVLVPLGTVAALLASPPFWLLERTPDCLILGLMRVEPGVPRPRIVLGERLLTRGETRAALRQFERAAALGSQDLRLAVDIADAMRSAGLFDRAAAQCAELMKLEPSSGRLHRILGQCQLELGRQSEGLSSLDQATQLDPHDAEAWIALAEAKVGISGFQPAAAQVWGAGLRSNPGQRSLQYGLAEAQVGLGQYEEAQALLKDLPRHAVPEALQARERYARAWAAWGTVLHRLQPDATRRSQACRALERALTLSPRQPDARYELALALADDGQWAAARHSLQSAIELRPYAHPFWFHLARVDRRLGMVKQADHAEARFNLLVSTFADVNRESQYLDAHPGDTVQRLRLAQLLISREDWDAAALHLSLVLRDHPGHPLATRLMQRLRTTRNSGSGALQGA